MKVNIDCKKLFCSLLVAGTLFALNAETFRVSKMNTVQIESDINSEAVVKVGINEAVAVFLPEDKTFLEGLEIKMEIPDTIAAWMDSVACSVYDKVNPVPSNSQIDYSATRQYVSTLPGRLSWVLQIPTKADNSIKANRYTTKMDTIPDISKNFVFVRLQPVMKGIPEEASNAKITMTIKPILIDKGLLNIKLKTPEENHNNCIIYIDDDIKTPDSNGNLLLSTGIHNISIISDDFRNEIRTIRISQAKTTEIEVEMQSIEPTLLITAPAGTKVYLDEEECKTLGQEFLISEGEHKIRFLLGNYELTRTITVLKGKTYTANCAIDLEIIEE